MGLLLYKASRPRPQRKTNLAPGQQWSVSSRFPTKELQAKEPEGMEARKPVLSLSKYEDIEWRIIKRGSNLKLIRQIDINI
ncbi:MAG: hypothetical protein WDZ41_05445 [Candidatus Babeliales bacterium]